MYHLMFLTSEQRVLQGDCWRRLARWHTHTSHKTLFDALTEQQRFQSGITDTLHAVAVTDDTHRLALLELEVII